MPMNRSRATCYSLGPSEVPTGATLGWVWTRTKGRQGRQLGHLHKRESEHPLRCGVLGISPGPGGDNAGGEGKGQIWEAPSTSVLVGDQQPLKGSQNFREISLVKYRGVLSWN